MQKQIKLKLRSIEKLLLHKALLPAVYEVYRHKPIAQKLVLFADSKNKDIPFSMQAMYDEMIKRGYQVENWCVDFGELTIVQKLNYLFRFMKRYSQAKYIFLCDYFLPVASCRKKKETKVVQLWHACGMLKKFGYDAADDLAGSILELNKNIDLWPVSAECCVPVYENACRLYDGQVKALGVSRTDIYFSDTFKRECVEEFYRTYPELIGKKLILWVPTFRGNAQAAELTGLKDILDLQKKLAEEWHILIKVHPHLAEKYAVDNCTISTERLYPVVDLMITDFSSVLFDYSLFEKPFIIFAPDYAAYMKTRGCYIDMQKEFPHRVAYTFNDLMGAINQSGFTIESIKGFQKQYLYHCDGLSTKRILDYLLLGK